MKKFLTLLTALLLLCTVAVADTDPATPVDADTPIGSITPEDYYTAVAYDEQGNPIDVILVLKADDAAHLDVYETELAKLAAAASVSEYFGEEAAADFAGLLGESAYSVYEFVPAYVRNYDPDKYDDITFLVSVPTPYARGERVVIMIGIVDVLADGTQTVAWKSFAGRVVEVDPATLIQVTLDEETLIAMQEEMALFAVVSK